MIGFDSKLEIIQFEEGYKIQLPLRQELKEYYAFVNSDSSTEVFLFEVYENGENKKRFVRHYNQWLLDRAECPHKFFPSESLEHRAFEMLHETIEDKSK
jgi:hypothetical protein